MSGCQQTNTDPCMCACHKMGGFGIQYISNCCKCTQQLGYSPIETLQVCKHGRPLKFGCTLCYSEECLHELKEENSSPMVKQIQHLEERINKVEKENDMRKDTIACIDQAYNDAHLDLEKRIMKLEEHKNYQINENRKISRRVDEIAEAIGEYCFDERISFLEKTTSELVNKIAEIGNFYYKEKKTPYKCPVCDGKYIAIFKECESACLSCDKGIVWN